MLKMKVKDEILAKINSELVMEAMAQDVADYRVSKEDLTQNTNEKKKKYKTEVSLIWSMQKLYQENINEIEEKQKR